MPAITSVSSNPSWVQQRTNEPCLSECFLNTACGEISNHSRRGQVPKGRSAWARPKPTGVSVMSYKKSYPGLYAPPLDRGKEIGRASCRERESVREGAGTEE